MTRDDSPVGPLPQVDVNKVPRFAGVATLMRAQQRASASCEF